MDVATEELHECQLLDTEWPLHGNIEFQNVTLKYRPSLPAALCDLTCTFAGGTQVCSFMYLLLCFVLCVLIRINKIRSFFGTSNYSFFSS